MLIIRNGYVAILVSPLKGPPIDEECVWENTEIATRGLVLYKGIIYHTIHILGGLSFPPSGKGIYCTRGAHDAST